MVSKVFYTGSSAKALSRAFAGARRATYAWGRYAVWAAVALWGAPFVSGERLAARVHAPGAVLREFSEIAS